MANNTVDDKLVIRMSSADKESISDAAEAKGISMSQWCRDILLREAAKQEFKQLQKKR